MLKGKLRCIDYNYCDDCPLKPIQDYCDDCHILEKEGLKYKTTGEIFEIIKEKIEEELTNEYVEEEEDNYYAQEDYDYEHRIEEEE